MIRKSLKVKKYTKETKDEEIYKKLMIKKLEKDTNKRINYSLSEEIKLINAKRRK